MSFRTLGGDEWERTMRRALLIGPPNSFKTTSILTWPRPTRTVVYPGELGAGSLPTEADGMTSYVWEEEATHSPRRDWRAIQAFTKRILAQEEGPVTTFAGDGLHKLYETIYQASLADLIEANESRSDFDPDRLSGRAYGVAHREFRAYLRMVCNSNVPYVVFTCWSAREKDNPEDRKSKSHWWPDLPGELAKWVLGEFSVVMYAESGLPQPNGMCPSSWILKPQGAVWGVGVKAPLHITKALPAAVPQDWKKLEPLLLGRPS